MDITVKVIKPKGIASISLYVLISMLLIGTIIGFIYFCVCPDTKEFPIAFIIVFIVGAICVFVMEVCLYISQSCKKIVIDKDEVKVKKDKGLGLRIIQHEVNLRYSTINDIKLVVSAVDTNGREQVGLIIPMPNIFIGCDNEGFKMINVYEYSKKQRIEIMDEIIKRAQAVGKLLESPNGEELIKQANEQYYGSKKKKK